MKKQTSVQLVITNSDPSLSRSYQSISFSVFVFLPSQYPDLFSTQNFDPKTFHSYFFAHVGGSSRVLTELDFLLRKIKLESFTSKHRLKFKQQPYNGKLL